MRGDGSSLLPHSEWQLVRLPRHARTKVRLGTRAGHDDREVCHVVAYFRYGAVSARPVPGRRSHSNGRGSPITKSTSAVADVASVTRVLSLRLIESPSRP